VIVREADKSSFQSESRLCKTPLVGRDIFGFGSEGVDVTGSCLLHIHITDIQQMMGRLLASQEGATAQVAASLRELKEKIKCNQAKNGGFARPTETFRERDGSLPSTLRGLSRDVEGRLRRNGGRSSNRRRVIGRNRVHGLETTQELKKGKK
jgi:hypothetical protein